MNELVSVIIPTYKRVNILKRAILSVLNQTHTFFEILVVNDNDDDDDEVLEIIRSLKDKRIKYFRNERTKGANGARNTGILNSKGDFIAFLDDDDELLNTKIETQLKCLKSKENSFGGVYSGYLIEENNKWKNYFGFKEGGILKDVILDNVKICTGSNLLIKSSTIKNIGLWDEDLLRQQDLEFLIRFLNEYNIAFDNNLGAKIYGHNTPDPFKAFQAREKYLEKIKKYINLIDIKDQKHFYSTHYRRQALYLAKLKKFKEVRKYWKLASKFKMISIRKDIKVIYFYILGLIN